jgi:5-methylcytosine-specific restriction endonuclease McrA
MADVFVNEDELVDISDVETHLQRDFFNTVRLCEDSLRKKLDYNDSYMSKDSYRVYVKWYNKEFDESHSVPTQPNKREYSTTHRIEIAYRSEYKCNACKVLLPPTFQVDHIVELRHGGDDAYENLQALCPNCHALKTRANDLRRHDVFSREFSKRADAMESVAFSSFKCKKSKYFI